MAVCVCVWILPRWCFYWSLLYKQKYKCTRNPRIFLQSKYIYVIASRSRQNTTSLSEESFGLLLGCSSLLEDVARIDRIPVGTSRSVNLRINSWVHGREGQGQEPLWWKLSLILYLEYTLPLSPAGRATNNPFLSPRFHFPFYTKRQLVERTSYISKDVFSHSLT